MWYEGEEDEKGKLSGAELKFVLRESGHGEVRPKDVRNEQLVLERPKKCRLINHENFNQRNGRRQIRNNSIPTTTFQ